MSFISEEEIRNRLDLLFKEDNFNKDCFSKSGASYDLRLGKEALVTPGKEPKQLKEGEILNIGPGQFAVLITKEFLRMPNDLLGFITIRFRYKSKGLVNISGFHVDPGFKGNLVFSVYNAGPSTVTLRGGEKVFSIFFAKISPPTTYENGDYNEQKRIPLDIIETLAGARIPSLQLLEDRVNRNWTTLKIYGILLTGIVLSMLGALFRIVLPALFV